METQPHEILQQPPVSSNEARNDDAANHRWLQFHSLLFTKSLLYLIQRFLVQ